MTDEGWGLDNPFGSDKMESIIKKGVNNFNEYQETILKQRKRIKRLIFVVVCLGRFPKKRFFYYLLVFRGVLQISANLASRRV